MLTKEITMNKINEHTTVSANIALVEPTMDWAFEFLAMAYEFQRAGDDRFRRATDNFAAYMDMLQNYTQGVNLSEGHVQTETPAFRHR